MASRKRKLPASDPEPVAKPPRPAKRAAKEKKASEPEAEVAQQPEGGTGVFPNPSIRVMSWNVNGLRAWAQKEGVMEVIGRADIDVLCLNETKLQEPAIPSVRTQFPSFPHQYWTCSTAKKGYSGVALLSRTQPISVSFGLGKAKHDDEGRAITAEFSDLFVVATYVPNAGQKLERLDYRTGEWDKDLKAHLLRLTRSSKEVVWLGDLNIIHNDIDIYSMKGKSRCAGCTEEEKTSFSDLLQSGFADSFREKYPEKKQFSWFSAKNKSAREQNQGWRLDYAVVSRALMPRVQDSLIYDQVEGSDHVPIEIVLQRQ